MYICIYVYVHVYISVYVYIFMYTYMYLYMNIHVYSYKYLMYSHIYGKRMFELRSNALREQMVSERRNAVSKSRVVCFPRTTQVVIWLRHCFSTAKRHQHEFFSVQQEVLSEPLSFLLLSRVEKTSKTVFHVNCVS